MPKVSMIVPVYRAEAYLHACIDSILSQTFSGFELILVDDGSPDNCGAICDDYAARDSRVRVIHQENQGQAAARNHALAAAKGDWVCFVDSDDAVHPQMLERLRQAAAGSGAMCRFYLKDPLLPALNVLPFALLALLLFGLTGRAWLAFLLDGVVCLVYSWAAYWKWLGRSEPLYADDVAAIREAVQIGGRGYITVTWQIAASLLLVVLGTLALAWLARGRLSRRGRAATTGAALLLCVLGYFGVYRSSPLYDRFAVAPGRSAWSANDQFQSRGGIYPFLHSIRAAVPKAPER